jgi:hypothetical protein
MTWKRYRLYPGKRIIGSLLRLYSLVHLICRVTDKLENLFGFCPSQKGAPFSLATRGLHPPLKVDYNIITIHTFKQMNSETGPKYICVLRSNEVQVGDPKLFHQWPYTWNTPQYRLPSRERHICEQWSTMVRPSLKSARPNGDE